MVKKIVGECGCVMDGEAERYISMCEEHMRAYRTIRERWHAEHRAREAERREFFAKPAGKELSTVKVLKVKKEDRP